MAIPKVGDGEQVGDGNTNEVLNVGRSGQALQIGGAATTLVGFYGATPVVRAAAIAAPTDLATSIVAINAIRVALTNLGVTA
jgi:hypothetical protein